MNTSDYQQARWYLRRKGGGAAFTRDYLLLRLAPGGRRAVRPYLLVDALSTIHITGAHVALHQRVAVDYPQAVAPVQLLTLPEVDEYLREGAAAEVEVRNTLGITILVQEAHAGDQGITDCEQPVPSGHYPQYLALAPREREAFTKYRRVAILPRHRVNDRLMPHDYRGDRRNYLALERGRRLPDGIYRRGLVLLQRQC